LITFEEFKKFAAILSFTDEEAVIDFIFQLCDFNNDGKICSNDMRLFVNFY